MDNLVINMLKALLDSNKGKLFNEYDYFIDYDKEGNVILFRLFGDMCFNCVYLNDVSNIEVYGDRILFLEGEDVSYRLMPNRLKSLEELEIENNENIQAITRMLQMQNEKFAKLVEDKDNDL